MDLLKKLLYKRIGFVILTVCISISAVAVSYGVMHNLAGLSTLSI